jgi:hypothetical protein
MRFGCFFLDAGCLDVDFLDWTRQVRNVWLGVRLALEMSLSLELLYLGLLKITLHSASASTFQLSYAHYSASPSP